MKNKLNGSAERFTEALRDLVREATQEAVEPIEKKMDEGFERVDKNFADRINTTNENMQAQFAEQQKSIGQLSAKVDRFASGK